MKPKELQFMIVDDEGDTTLTVSDIKELKRLARLSKTTRYVVTFLMGTILAMGIPTLLELIQRVSKHG